MANLKTNTKKSSTYLLMTLMLTIVIDIMGFSLVFPILPALFVSGKAILVGTHLSLKMRYVFYGIALALWPVGTFFGTPYLGQLSDKFGRKNLLIVCLIVTGIGYSFYAIAIYLHSAILFFVTRLFSGFFGGNYDIAQAATADISPKELKMRNMGWISVAAAIGMIIGPAIASFTTSSRIISWFSIVTPFWIAATFAILNAILIMILFRETYKTKKKTHISLSKIFSAFLFIFTDKRVILLGIAFFLLNLGWGFYLTAMPLILTQIFHFSIQFAGIFFCVLGIGSIFAILFVQPLILQKTSLKNIFIYCAIIIAVLLIISDIHPSLKEMWIAVFVFAVLQILCFSSLLAMCSNAVTIDEQGKVMGGIGAVTSVSFFAASMLLAWLTHFSVMLPLIVAAIAFGLSGLLMLKHTK
jgi:MFS family permease